MKLIILLYDELVLQDTNFKSQIFNNACHSNTTYIRKHASVIQCNELVDAEPDVGKYHHEVIDIKILKTLKLAMKKYLWGLCS